MQRCITSPDRGAVWSLGGDAVRAVSQICQPARPYCRQRAVAACSSADRDVATPPPLIDTFDASVQLLRQLDSVHHRLSSLQQLPTQLQDQQALAHAVQQLTDILATHSTSKTLEVVNRCPELLQLPLQQVASKVLQLKLLLPDANIGELLYYKPSLLLLEDLPGVVTPALSKLHALMPGIPVDGKLHQGGTVWWSFSSLLDEQAAAHKRLHPGGQPRQADG